LATWLGYSISLDGGVLSLIVERWFMKALEAIESASLGPEALKAVGQAFDEAWADIADSAGADPLFVHGRPTLPDCTYQSTKRRAPSDVCGAGYRTRLTVSAPALTFIRPSRRAGILSFCRARRLQRTALPPGGAVSFESGSRG
jgi:hypothetical protein